MQGKNIADDHYGSAAGVYRFQLCASCGCRFMWKYRILQDKTKIQSFLGAINRRVLFDSFSPREKAHFLACLLYDFVLEKQSAKQETSEAVYEKYEDSLRNIFESICAFNEKLTKTDDALIEYQVRIHLEKKRIMKEEIR